MGIPGQRVSTNPAEQARLWRVALSQDDRTGEAFGDLELLRARFSEFTFPPHAHDEYFIAVTERGRASPRFWGEAQRITPGDVFVLQPGEIHSGGPTPGSTWQYRAFYLPAALVQRAAQEIGIKGGILQFRREVFSDPRVIAQLTQAHIALEGTASSLERETHLLQALAGLIKRHSSSIGIAPAAGREHRAVKRAKEYLERFPGENISLQSLAEVAGLSSFHLCRVFREETGFSPHAYQLLVRVKFAKAMLAEGVPISQAALEAGFFDQAHLARHFKRFFGVTPGRYPG